MPLKETKMKPSFNYEISWEAKNPGIRVMIWIINAVSSRLNGTKCAVR
jgi:hypothetical protein